MHRQRENHIIAKIKLSLLALLLLGLLQGCLLHRLERSRDQLCRGQVHLTFNDQAVVSFDRPTLYDTDIIKILGAAPSERMVGGEELVFSYYAEKMGDTSGEYDIPVQFTFVMDGGRYKLTKAAMDQSILGGLSHKLIGQLFLSVCRAKIVGQTIQVDMSGIDTGLLPDRKMVWQLLGAPNAMEENHDLFRYAVNGVQTSQIRIAFDANSGQVAAMKIVYFRYVLDLDFTTQLAIGKMKNWRDSLKLGFLATFSP